jgi:hypothetical protein
LYEYQKERDHYEYRGTDGRIILKWILNKQHGKVWIGFISLRIGISGEHL